MAKKATKTENERILEKARKVITELKPQSELLTKKDIAAWRKAHQMAINIDNPRRSDLYNIYDFTVDLDTQVTGVTRRIKFGVGRRKFRMVDIQSGKEDPEVTNLLDASWFKKSQRLYVDSYHYGHSLIQFGDLMESPQLRFNSVELIPRRHVCPEYGVLLPQVGDEPLKKGIPYRTGGMTDWCLECGESDNLGLYLKVAPPAISKKHVLIFWDNFAEKFGLPIIYGTSTSNNDSDLVKMEDMLRNMGNSTWGLFPEGTVLSLIETAKGDAFQVFDKRVELADKQICIALAGQTMVFMDGSSRAQAQVHEDGFEELKETYADEFKDWVNISLIPFCIKHGFPFAGYRFEWDNSKQYTPDQLKDVIQMLLDAGYEIPDEYLTDLYNIPIIGRKERQPQIEPRTKPEKKPGTKGAAAKKDEKLFFG